VNSAQKNGERNRCVEINRANCFIHRESDHVFVLETKHLATFRVLAAH